ncbi:MAG TPA: hypothetical protein VHX68_00220, partial [Planctomycetaceae bacterium]|nr:hypothetical protein [Planctomycetaceae bacterium]
MRPVRAMLRFLPIVLVALFLFLESVPGTAEQTPVQRARAIPPRNPVPNPLANRLRSLLGNGGNANARPKSEGEDTAAAGDRRGPRDMIDGRVPHN